ncbi:hypothetical protein PMN64_15665 [Bradyrhizobium sp. UFLA01-814]|uniref:hypothetical protein n=1 Tax=Bradyrhizobium sp. UFLA01-814 TaxID=3023480 RepID=UPI00398B6DB8
MKEMFFWVLIGTLIIFAITTLFTDTGLGVRFRQDEDMLFAIQVVSRVNCIGGRVAGDAKPARRGLGRSQHLFDVRVDGFGEVAPISNHGIALFQNVVLK